MDKKSILIFGVGELQKSIINRAKKMGLFVVGIDPCADAVCRDEVDAFEVVGGQDYEGTLAVAKKYKITAVVTAATDKPLVMMARIAKELDLPFYSEETARISTDKYMMKECFRKAGIPCANGGLIKNIDEAEGLVFPVILKPRDNSGSRGVIFCNNKAELELAFNEAMQYTKLDSVLVEEFIDGPEYSIESLHFDGKSEVVPYWGHEEWAYIISMVPEHQLAATVKDCDKWDEFTAKEWAQVYAKCDEVDEKIEAAVKDFSHQDWYDFLTTCEYPHDFIGDCPDYDQLVKEFPDLEEILN